MKVLLSCFLFVLASAIVDGEQPNVIVIMTDDQGYGEFSCHGNPLVQTPHIDQLASQSIRMTDFHVAPMCTPTRAQLLTGLDAFRTGAINVSSGRTLLSAKLKTMADVFSDAGYRTGLFGKWHLGDNFPFRPQDRGFDETLWFPSSHINSVPDYWDNDYFEDTYVHNGKREAYTGYCTDVFFGEAMRWIQRPSDQPFFVYLPLNAAHYPWFVPDHYREPVRQALAEKPGIAQAMRKRQKELENLIGFLAMGLNIDENMGRLAEFLQERSLADNTVVVFLTDNGSTFGERYFNAGMRGKKTQLWEGGHRVPCFVKDPTGSLGEAREVSTLTHVQDLLPTLAGLASAKNHLPRILDGNDWGPMLRGEDHDWADRKLVINYSRMPTFKVTYTNDNPAIPKKNGAAVLWKSWRLIENKWLYDVRNDPHQDQDVAADHPNVVQRMRQHLDAWWESVREDVMTPQRVIIGSDHENPQMLTACEWLDVFVDQQLQVRLGQRKNGVWHLFADQAGFYTIELRRYPRESGLGLRAEFPPTPVTDGTFLAGRKLPIAVARLEVAGQEHMMRPDEDQRSLSTTVELPAGPLEMKATFLDDQGNELCGAYYVYIERIR
ncbi:MAG: arylsulfatase [Planctomycetota bacterium]